MNAVGPDGLARLQPPCMSPHYPKTFTSYGILRAIPAELLLQFFAPHRDFLAARGFAWPAGPGQFSHYALHAALLKPSAVAPDKRLVAVMLMIDDMVHPDGVAALADAIREKHPEFPTPKDNEPAIFVLTQWFKNASLVENAHTRRFFNESRIYYSFRTTAALPASTSLDSAQFVALEATVANYLAESYPRESVQFRRHHDGKLIRFLVRHGGPLERECVVNEDDPSQSESYLFRREVFDIVVYDPEASELMIHAQPHDCDLYTRAFGAHFTGDEHAFADTDKYTLAPLINDGPACLNCAHIPGLKKINLVEVEFFQGDPLRTATIRRATDVFALRLQDEKGLKAGGKPQSARFEVTFANSKHTQFVTVQTPNMVKFKHDADGMLIEQWLRDAGFIIRHAKAAQPGAGAADVAAAT